MSPAVNDVKYLLDRLGFTPEVPVRRAVERDEAAIAEWRAVTWVKARAPIVSPGLSGLVGPPGLA